MEVHKAYHYTSQSLWMAMKGGLFGRDLSPCGQEGNSKGVFALHDPEPREWTQSTEFPKIWAKLLRHTVHDDFVLVRLEWDILPDDHVYVSDWAHMERVRSLMRKMENQIKLEDREKSDFEAAKSKYESSRILIREYTTGYSLPELVFRNTIKYSRLSAVEMGIIQNGDSVSLRKLE